MKYELNAHIFWHREGRESERIDLHETDKGGLNERLCRLAEQTEYKDVDGVKRAVRRMLAIQPAPVVLTPDTLKALANLFGDSSEYQQRTGPKKDGDNLHIAQAYAHVWARLRARADNGRGLVGETEKVLRDSGIPQNKINTTKREHREFLERAKAVCLKREEENLIRR